MARPTRTIVAPSSMAISKSSVIPIDSSRRPAASRRARELAEVRAGVLRRTGRRAWSSGPRRQSCGSRRRASSAGKRLGRDAALARLAADVHLDQHARASAARRGVRAPRVSPSAALSTVWIRSKASTRARRLVALQMADQMPAQPPPPTAARLPPLPARSSRRCRATPAAIAARTSSAGLVFATAISRTLVGIAAGARRRGGDARAHRGDVGGDVEHRHDRALGAPPRGGGRGRSARAGRAPRRPAGRRRCCTSRSTRADEAGGAALDAVGAGLVERLAGRRRRRRSRRPSAGGTRPCVRTSELGRQRAAGRSQRHGGQHLVRAAGQALQHAARVGGVGRLAEDGAVERPRRCRPTAPSARRGRAPRRALLARDAAREVRRRLTRCRRPPGTSLARTANSTPSSRSSAARRGEAEPRTRRGMRG